MNIAEFIEELHDLDPRDSDYDFTVATMLRAYAEEVYADGYGEGRSEGYEDGYDKGYREGQYDR